MMGYCRCQTTSIRRDTFLGYVFIYFTMISAYNLMLMKYRIILVIPKYLSNNIFIRNVFWYATCMNPWILNGWLHICVNNKKYVWSYLWCFPESILLLVLLIWLWQNWFLRIRCATYKCNLKSAYDGLSYATVYVSSLSSWKHFHCNIEVLISR